MTKNGIHSGQILDVTLRDGGYLNDWAFTEKQVLDFAKLVSALPVDIVEVGYLCGDTTRNLAARCPLSLLRSVRMTISGTKLAVMLRPSEPNLEHLIAERHEFVDLVRIPCSLPELDRAVQVSNLCDEFATAASLNLTSVSAYSLAQLLEAVHLICARSAASILYLADSRGALDPARTAEVVRTLRAAWPGTLGFHAHDNLGYASANSRAALEHGCDIVDGSIGGIGLGGGNADLAELLGLNYGQTAVDSARRIEDDFPVRRAQDGCDFFALSGARNLEQEWVEPIREQFGEEALAYLSGIPWRRYQKYDQLPAHRNARVLEAVGMARRTLRAEADSEQSESYHVVRNDEGAFSIWPSQLEVPVGWTAVGAPDQKGECLKQIRSLWTDVASVSSLITAEGGHGVDDSGSTHSSATTIDCFTESAREYGQRVALICQDEELTFAELDAQSSWLANEILQHIDGVEPIVGMHVERSIESVICLIAIWKAGAVYLPLDPGHPTERLDIMVADAKPSVIISRSGYSGKAPIHTREIFLDSNDVRLANSPVTPEFPTPPRKAAHSLAIISYTSGSTGSPKGVAVTHAQVLNRYDWMWRESPFTDDDVACHTTALNVLNSTWEVFGPLIKGVPVVVVPRDVFHDRNRFVDLLERRGVTRIWLTPTIIAALLRECTSLQQRLARLRMVIASGEPLDADLCSQFHCLFSQRVTLYNLYGTTEVWDVTWYKSSLDSDRLSIPIGREIANARTRILDESFRPVPPGTVGELYVGSSTLARGYYNRPDRTAERFLPDPFRQDGARMYRTGDLAMLRENGILDLRGRIDDQVQIDGLRIEPAEIEFVIRQHSSVADAAVLVIRQPEHTHFVAFVAGQVGDATHLREHVCRRLPKSMVPTYFVFVDPWPLTINGKTDRLSLRRSFPSQLPESETSGIEQRYYRANEESGPSGSGSREVHGTTATRHVD